MKFKTDNLKITWKRKTLRNLKIRQSLETIIGDAEIVSYRGNNCFITNDGRKIVTGFPPGVKTVTTIETGDEK